MKLVILATDSSSTWMMVNALMKDHPDLQVAIEKPISRAHILKRRMARIGIIKVLGQICFMLYLPILRRLNISRIKKLITEAKLSSNPPAMFSVSQFDTVNSVACIAWLREQKPTVVVLNGTRIVSPELLSSCNAIFLNTHCGITPAYRGVHGGYWALACGDNENVGVTIHVVDTGVDTGSIVFQEAIEIHSYDNFLTYPVKQYIAGIPLMRRAISDVASGLLKTYRRDDLWSGIWHHPTLFQYIRTGLFHGVW